MGYTTSTIHGIEVPDSAQANNIPTDLGKIVTALEGGSLVKRLTSTQINALTSGQKPAGLLVFNSTTNKLQISNGSTFTDVIDASGGTMGAALAMGGSKITGLGAGTANGDAIRYEQVLASSTTLISGLYSASNPVMNGTAAVGTSAQPARSDHVHPADTSKLDAANVKAGFWDGTTDANGRTTVTVGSPPSGKTWAVTATLSKVSGNAGIPYGTNVGIYSTTSSTVTFQIANYAYVISNAACAFHWQAVAY